MLELWQDTVAGANLPQQARINSLQVQWSSRGTGSRACRAASWWSWSWAKTHLWTGSLTDNDGDYLLEVTGSRLIFDRISNISAGKWKRCILKDGWWKQDSVPKDFKYFSETTPGEWGSVEHTQLKWMLSAESQKWHSQQQFNLNKLIKCIIVPTFNLRIHVHPIQSWNANCGVRMTFNIPPSREI